MTLRESDDRIVPMKLEDQSSGWKSSNIDEGKAVRISRDQDWAPTVLCDGPTVATRLYRSLALAVGVQDHTTLFSPRVRPLAARRRLSVTCPFAWEMPSEIWEPDARKWHVRI
jgi:hypothetical protein